MKVLLGGGVIVRLRLLSPAPQIEGDDTHAVDW